jgi:para-aminobenzoate synthetase component 1
VTGELKDDRDAIDLLRGCFPGGSITGAPKLRAMQIIEELEPHRRGVYCGAIGYIGFDGGMDMNIAIRTMVLSRGQIRFWAGGGIIADSNLEDEYQETFDKASAMLSLLQQSAARGVKGELQP